MKLNLEVLEIQKWNIPTNRTQRVDKKNEVICLLIMFIPRASKMSQMTNFLYSADGSKKSVTGWANYLTAPKRSYWLLSENGMVNRLWSFRSWDIEGRNLKKLLNQQKAVILYF